MESLHARLTALATTLREWCHLDDMGSADLSRWARGEMARCVKRTARPRRRLKYVLAHMA